MLFKYKGFTIDGEIKRGYTNATSYKDAVVKIKNEEEIVFIEYLGDRVDRPIINKIRNRMDTEFAIIEDKIDNIKVKTHKNKSNKNKSNFFKNMGEKKRERDILSILKTISINDDLSVIVNKIKDSNKPISDDDLFDDFNFQTEQELYKENLNGRPQLINNESVRVESSKRGEKKLDWDSIEGDVVVANKSSRLKVKPNEIMLFTRRLQIMIASGLSLIKSLNILQKGASKNFKIILENIINDIQNGESFSKSLSNYPKQFDYTYVALVSVGEKSGSLPECLTDIVEIQKQRAEIKGKLKTASIYPTLIGVLLILMMTLASIFFIPTFKANFVNSDVPMPLITEIVFKGADVFPYISIGIFAFIIAFKFLQKKSQRFNRFIKTHTDRIVFKIPVVNNVLMTNYMFSFSSTVSLMLKNGIRLQDTLALASKTINNIYIKNEIANASALMLQGLSFTEAIREQKHFDDILVNIILTGEESGQLDSTLKQISEYYKDELALKVAKLMELVQPVTMIIIGLIVGPIVVAMYIPILDMSSGAFM